jgi:type VI protein secretion system component VasF
MSKRSFEEFSTPALDSRYLSVLDHANDLLNAAQSLKRDLERLGRSCHEASHEKIFSTLKRHNAEILLAAQALSQDEVGTS